VNVKEFFYPFSWKTPWVYIAFIAAVCVYLWMFYLYREPEIANVIETSLGYRVFSVLVLMFFPFGIFRYAPAVAAIKSAVVRCLVLLGVFVLLLLIWGKAWPFAVYHGTHITVYNRIVPGENSPFYAARTIVFSDITAVREYYGVEGGSHLRYVLNNGTSLTINVPMPVNARKKLHAAMVHKCPWLRVDFEQIYGPGYFQRDAYRATANDPAAFFANPDLPCLFFIWGILVQAVCLIVFAVRGKLR